MLAATTTDTQIRRGPEAEGYFGADGSNPATLANRVAAVTSAVHLPASIRSGHGSAITRWENTVMAFMKHIFHGRVAGTPQDQPQTGKEQVKNTGGGFVYALDDWARVDRFLILGAEGGTFYVAEHKLVAENAQHLRKMIREHGVDVVRRIVAVSTSGRAPKQDPAIFALAMCAGWGDAETRHAALADGLCKVCRTASHLLQFASYIEQFRGWGRGLRRAIAAWYNDRAVDELAYQIVKYQNRHDWANRDLMRLAHPNAVGDDRQLLYKWIAGKAGDTFAGDAAPNESLRLVWAFERAKSMTAVLPEVGAAAQMAAFVAEQKLPREAVPTEWLREPAVWDALLADMPMTAMLRNLATMTRVGLLTPHGAATAIVLDRLRDGERLRKARVHPIAVLAALVTYAGGRGVRGTNEWKPTASIVAALDAAFYASFGNVQPLGGRLLIGLDVSGSMAMGCVAGVPNLTPRAASCSLAAVHVATEDRCDVMAFSHTFAPFAIDRGEKLERVVERANSTPFGNTDCALPMLYAIEKRLEVDTFVVYTDNETWFGQIHPDEALRRYREQSGLAAKLVVVGMTSTGFTIADPNDAGMLDIVGFDSAAPNLIAAFAREAVG
ncbi:MAG TPA: TROVE domain-containing protein [Candidatus Eremiobacteraceae bacterium]